MTVRPFCTRAGNRISKSIGSFFQIFVFKAYYEAGSVKPQNEDVSSFKWLLREEMNEVMNKQPGKGAILSILYDTRENI